MTDTAFSRTCEVADLVHVAIPGHCSHCGQQVTGPLGVVVEDAIYGGYLVTLIDRSYPHPATERLACNPKELLRLEEMDTIHASPQDIATAVEVGWLEPGAEFYGCQFRS